MTIRKVGPGRPWRILVHNRVGGAARHVQSEPPRHLNDAATSTTTTLPDTDFDELVIAKWAHIEQMDSKSWWMNIGGVTLWVNVDRSGRPTAVTVYGPDTYAAAEPGCDYDFTWKEPA